MDSDHPRSFFSGLLQAYTVYSSECRPWFLLVSGDIRICLFLVVSSPATDLSPLTVLNIDMSYLGTTDRRFMWTSRLWKGEALRRTYLLVVFWISTVAVSRATGTRICARSSLVCFCRACDNFISMGVSSTARERASPGHIMVEPTKVDFRVWCRAHLAGTENWQCCSWIEKLLCTWKA